MSMLSSQCDNLRLMARLVRDYEPFTAYKSVPVTYSATTVTMGDLRSENAEMRELVRDMWRDGMCECDERGACAECEYHFPARMRKLGIEMG